MGETYAPKTQTEHFDLTHIGREHLHNMADFIAKTDREKKNLMIKVFDSLNPDTTFQIIEKNIDGGDHTDVILRSPDGSGRGRPRLSHNSEIKLVKTLTGRENTNGYTYKTMKDSLGRNRIYVEVQAGNQIGYVAIEHIGIKKTETAPGGESTPPVPKAPDTPPIQPTPVPKAPDPTPVEKPEQIYVPEVEVPKAPEDRTQKKSLEVEVPEAKFTNANTDKTVVEVPKAPGSRTKKSIQVPKKLDPEETLKIINTPDPDGESITEEIDVQKGSNGDQLPDPTPVNIGLDRSTLLDGADNVDGINGTTLKADKNGYILSPSGEKLTAIVNRYNDNGKIYSGEVKEGRFTGEGMMLFQNNSYYYGNFSDGKMNGSGIYTRADGLKFESYNGENGRHWKEGKYMNNDGGEYRSISELDNIKMN